MPVVLHVPTGCLRLDRHSGVNCEWPAPSIVSHPVLDFGNRVTGDDSGVMRHAQGQCGCREKEEWARTCVSSTSALILCGPCCQCPHKKRHPANVRTEISRLTRPT